MGSTVTFIWISRGCLHTHLRFTRGSWTLYCTVSAAFREVAWGRERWAKWRLSTFDLYPGGEGNGVQGQICDILRPMLAESLPAPLATQIPTLWIHTSGGAGGGVGSDIRSMSSILPICKCRCPPLMPLQKIVLNTYMLRWNVFRNIAIKQSMKTTALGIRSENHDWAQ